MIVSFRYTIPQLCRTINPKKATRRKQSKKTFEKWLKFWKESKLIHQAWTASPYVLDAIAVGEIRLTQVPYLQSLKDMSDYDLQMEGGIVDSVDEFIDKYFKGKKNAIVTVLTFELYSCSLAARSVFLGDIPAKVEVYIPF